jgi:phosphoglucosamine mutase
MSRKFFGTDGIRGVANHDPITIENAMRIGMAAGTVIKRNGLPASAVIGRDTRLSGPMLGAALASGFCSVGVDVLSLSVVPTPTVAFCARRGYGIGAVISASHNPARDNGIKLLSHEGGKLLDSLELEIEEAMFGEFDVRPTGGSVGTIFMDRALVGDYLAFLVSLVPERLEGMKVCVDAANGAAFQLAVAVLEELGAEVSLHFAAPDGMNINDHCGATHPSEVQRLTVSEGCDIGVAFDGDADRAVFSDDKGRLINGDRTMAIWGAHWNLEPPVVVGTVMSNSGFEHYLDSKGIKLDRAKVGDKYVSERISTTGAKVGGEQSGHIIFPHHGPTGDGLVTMLELLRVLKREGRPSSSFFEDFANWPQVLVNMRVADRSTWAEQAGVSDAIAEAESMARVNVRASGTQPIVRVMVEAEDESTRDRAKELIVTALTNRAGGSIYGTVDLTNSLGE